MYSYYVCSVLGILLHCVVQCIVCVCNMCIVLLAPGVSPIAVNKYIIINKNLSLSLSHTHNTGVPNFLNEGPQTAFVGCFVSHTCKHYLNYNAYVHIRRPKPNIGLLSHRERWRYIHIYLYNLQGRSQAACRNPSYYTYRPADNITL